MENAAKSLGLQRLSARYPEVASNLLNRVRGGSVISGEIDVVANQIWIMGQLWLVFLDGDDFGLTEDRNIYDTVKWRSTRPPRHSMEDEAQIFMAEIAMNMSKFEIRLGLDCVVQTIGNIMINNGGYDGMYQYLVSQRHRAEILD
jgi:hypothetical protein